MSLSLAVVYRSLAELGGAGVSWPQAVRAAAPRGDVRWAAAGAALDRGVAMTEALGPLVPPVDRAGIRAGEASGRLEEALRALSDRHEEADRRARDARTAMTYPVFVAHVAALLLPFPDWIAGRKGAAVLWALAVLVPTYAVLLWQRRARRAEEAGHPTRSGALARLLRSSASVEDADARAFSALGWLHDAGVPPLEAIPLATDAGRGGRAALDLALAGEIVRRGGPFSEAWSHVPASVAQQLSTGEATGHLGEACRRVAEALSESAHHRRQRSMAILRPVAILFLGLVVGARVISFYVRALALPGLR